CICQFISQSCSYFKCTSRLSHSYLVSLARAEEVLVSAKSAFRVCSLCLLLRGSRSSTTVSFSGRGSIDSPVKSFSRYTLSERIRSICLSNSLATSEKHVLH